MLTVEAKSTDPDSYQSRQQAVKKLPWQEWMKTAIDVDVQGCRCAKVQGSANSEIFPIYNNVNDVNEMNLWVVFEWKMAVHQKLTWLMTEVVQKNKNFMSCFRRCWSQCFDVQTHKNIHMLRWWNNNSQQVQRGRTFVTSFASIIVFANYDGEKWVPAF